MESPKIWIFIVLLAGGFFYLGRASKTVRTPAAQVVEADCPSPTPAPETASCSIPAPVAAPKPQVATTSIAAKPVPPVAQTEPAPENEAFKGEWEYKDRSDSIILKIESDRQGLSGGYMARLPSVMNSSFSGDFDTEDTASDGRGKILVLDEFVRLRISDPSPTNISGVIEVMDEQRGSWDPYKSIILQKVDYKRM